MEQPRNKTAGFAAKILSVYAKENKICARSTSDLSPLEEWLILRLYNVHTKGLMGIEMEELQNLTKFLKAKGLKDKKMPLDLWVGIMEYFAINQETKP